MTEVQFHPGEARRKTRVVRISPAAGAAIALAVVGAGTATVTGLLGAPALLSDLVRSVDRLALRETAKRGAEAFATVGRRADKLSRRLAADELFLARVGLVAGSAPPAGFPTLGASGAATEPAAVEAAVTALARRLRIFELYRRRLASLPGPGGSPDPLRIPSRSPVEPSAAVPLTLFGLRLSELTHQEEFFPGLLLAAPVGLPVLAPGSGTVVWSGPAPKKSDAAWRRLGNLVILAHDDDTRTVFGHLAKGTLPRGRRVRRGDPVGRVGTSGFAPAPRLHYEVCRRTPDGFLPVDPRLYILDVDWITAEELASRPVAPKETVLPAFVR
jgi:murein DD-endopeptidase MepM/ murein hydrolase activator NlpD